MGKYYPHFTEEEAENCQKPSSKSVLESELGLRDTMPTGAKKRPADFYDHSWSGRQFHFSSRMGHFQQNSHGSWFSNDFKGRASPSEASTPLNVPSWVFIGRFPIHVQTLLGSSSKPEVAERPTSEVIYLHRTLILLEFFLQEMQTLADSNPSHLSSPHSSLLIKCKHGPCFQCGFSRFVCGTQTNAIAWRDMTKCCKEETDINYPALLGF